MRYLVNWSVNNGAMTSAFTASNYRDAKVAARKNIQKNLFPGQNGKFAIFNYETNQLLDLFFVKYHRKSEVLYGQK